MILDVALRGLGLILGTVVTLSTCAAVLALGDAWLSIFRRLRVDAQRIHALTRRVAALERKLDPSSKPGIHPKSED